MSETPITLPASTVYGHGLDASRERWSVVAHDPARDRHVWLTMYDTSAGASALRLELPHAIAVRDALTAWIDQEQGGSDT